MAATLGVMAGRVSAHKKSCHRGPEGSRDRDSNQQEPSANCPRVGRATSAVNCQYKERLEVKEKGQTVKDVDQDFQKSPREVSNAQPRS